MGFYHRCYTGDSECEQHCKKQGGVHCFKKTTCGLGHGHMVSAVCFQSILTAKQHGAEEPVKLKQWKLDKLKVKALYQSNAYYDLWHEQTPKAYENNTQQNMAGDMVSSLTTSPEQHALVAPMDFSALVQVITLMKTGRYRHDFRHIIKSLGRNSSDRSNALLELPDHDPGTIEGVKVVLMVADGLVKVKLEVVVELEMCRGLIHMLVTPTEHIHEPGATDRTFGQELVQKRIEFLKDIQGKDLLGEVGFKMLMVQLQARSSLTTHACTDEANSNGATGLHTLAYYAKKHEHAHELLKALLDVSDLDVLTHQTPHNFLPIHIAARTGNSKAVSLIANRILEIMAAREAMQEGLKPYGWTPKEPDEIGGRKHVSTLASVCKMIVAKAEQRPSKKSRIR
eukprot:gene23955-9526_t